MRGDRARGCGIGPEPAHDCSELVIDAMMFAASLSGFPKQGLKWHTGPGSSMRVGER